MPWYLRNDFQGISFEIHLEIRDSRYVQISDTYDQSVNFFQKVLVNHIGVYADTKNEVSMSTGPKVLAQTDSQTHRQTDTRKTLSLPHTREVILTIYLFCCSVSMILHLRSVMCKLFHWSSIHLSSRTSQLQALSLVQNKLVPLWFQTGALLEGLISTCPLLGEQL